MSSPVPVQSDMITLGDILHAVWQRKWLCVIIVLAFFFGGLGGIRHENTEIHIQPDISECVSATCSLE